MTTAELLERFRWAIVSLETLRAKAGYGEPELEDDAALRTDARRFAHRLGNAPDEATAELDLIGDHAGAQAFWAFLKLRWAAVEASLLPSEFELVPNPLPYGVLTIAVTALLGLESPPAFGAAPGAVPGDVFETSAGASESAKLLQPRPGPDGNAGAVWEYSDVN